VIIQWFVSAEYAPWSEYWALTYSLPLIIFGIYLGETESKVLQFLKNNLMCMGGMCFVQIVNLAIYAMGFGLRPELDVLTLGIIYYIQGCIFEKEY
jgi:phosphatidylserine synthase